MSRPSPRLRRLLRIAARPRLWADPKRCIFHPIAGLRFDGTHIRALVASHGGLLVLTRHDVYFAKQVSRRWWAVRKAVKRARVWNHADWETP